MLMWFPSLQNTTWGSEVVADLRYPISLLPASTTVRESQVFFGLWTLVASAHPMNVG